MAGIGIVFNPNSKKNRRNPYRRRLLEHILGNSGIIRETRTPDDVRTVAREFLKRKIDILCICGGDGTIHHTLSAFIEVYGKKPLPMVYPLSGGTMNTIRADFRLKGTTEVNLRAIVRKYTVGDIFITAERDIMKVGARYGFMMGCGLVANFLEAYYEGGRTGPLKGFYVLGRVVLSGIVNGPFARRLFARVRARIVVDGQALRLRDFTCILLFAIRSLGLGFRPAWRAGERLGFFHLLATEMSPIAVVLKLWRIYRGGSLAGPKTYENITSRMSIDTGGRVKYMVDGDIYEEDGPVQIGPGPRIVFLLR